MTDPTAGLDELEISIRVITTLATIWKDDGSMDPEVAHRLVSEAFAEAGSQEVLAFCLAVKAATYARELATAKGKSLEQFIAEDRAATTLARLDVELDDDAS